MSHQANDELRENQHENAPKLSRDAIKKAVEAVRQSKTAPYYIYRDNFFKTSRRYIGKEYLKDDAGEVMLFASIDKALTFMSDALRQTGDLAIDADVLSEKKAGDMGFFVGKATTLELGAWMGGRDA